MPLRVSRNNGQSLIFEGGPFLTPLRLTFVDTGSGVSIVDGAGSEVAHVRDEDAAELDLPLPHNITLSIYAMNMTRGTNWLDMGIRAPHDVHIRRAELAPK